MEQKQLTKTAFILFLSLCSLNTYAQFGKVLKRGNVSAGKKLVKAATLSDQDMAILSLQAVKWTDDEILSVIGHEIGHVKLGHSKKRYKSAYSISAAKDLAVANTGAGKILADGEIGKFVENVANAQFSQSNESASDAYGFKFLVKHGFNYHAMEGAFKKLASLSKNGGKGSITSSHPGSAKRAARAKKWAQKEDKKRGH